MAHSIALSVSVLNVLLNIFVLFLVAIGAEIAQYATYKSAQLQLKRRGKAPFVTNPDDVFSSFTNNVKGARNSRNLLNLLFVLVSASLIFGELCSEVGVDASQRCEPKRLFTTGLCANAYDNLVSDSRIVANVYHTRIAAWDNQELEEFPIYEGFRKNFNGKEAFNHPPGNKSQRIIVSRCRASKPQRIEPYDVALTVSHSTNVWKKFISQVVTPNGSEPTKGYGDLTNNGKTLSAFLVVPTPNSTIHANVKIIEYHPDKHLRQLMMDYKKNATFTDVTIRNHEYMYSYNIWCAEFSQSTERFARALQVYRSVQLEDSEYAVQNVSIAGKLEETIPPMNASDTVRAAISMALISDKCCPGETFEYTECGIYHWKFIAPLLILFGLLVIYAITNGLMVMRENANMELPHSSSAWSAVALEYKMQSEGIQTKPRKTESRIGESRDGHLPRGVYRLVEGVNGNQEVILTFDYKDETSEEEDNHTRQETETNSNTESEP